MTVIDFSTNGHDRGPFDEDRDSTLPPHSQQAEEAVLGALLKNPNAIRLVAGVLEPKHFYSMRHQSIWKAALTLEAEGTPIDYHLLADMLERQGAYNLSGGLLYLSELSLATPTSAFIGHYARIVLRKSLQRGLISLTQKLAEAAWRDDKDPDDLIDEMMRRMAVLAARVAEDQPVSNAAAATAAWQALEAEQERLKNWDTTRGEYMAGWRTGLADLDRVLLGLKPGDLIYLAARTSVGKSILAQQIAMNVANQQGAVFFASLEMSVPKLVQRSITMMTGVLRHELARGNVSDSEKARVKEAVERMQEMPLAWDSKARTTEQIRRKAQRWSDEIGKPLALIVVDYVQLLRDQAGPRANRYENVSVASHALKDMAESLECTVLAPAQVTRGVMNRSNKMPDLSDLRESGDLEQDCDIALGLDRANYHDPNSEDLTASLAVLKARDLAAGRGRGSVIPLAWRPDCERYADLAQGNVVPFRRHTILPDDEKPSTNGHVTHAPETEDLPF